MIWLATVNFMRHEYPYTAASNDAIEESDHPVLINRSNKEKAATEMVATEKENNYIPLGSKNSNAPIPEHIYDVIAKTFYKLGQFLGKVIFLIFKKIYLCVGRICHMLSSYVRSDRKAICSKNCSKIIFD